MELAHDDAAVSYYDSEEGPPFEEGRLFDEDCEESDEESGADGSRFGGLLRSRGPGPLAELGVGAVGGVWQLLGYSGSAVDHLSVADEAARRGALAGEPEAHAPADSSFAFRDRSGGVAQEASGVFEKRSPWWVEGWRPRDYVLRDGRLSWFARHRPDKPLGVLDFGLVRYHLHCGWRREGASAGSAGEAPEKPRAAPCDACDEATPKDWRVIYLVPSAFPSKVFAFRGPGEQMVALASILSRLTCKWMGPSTGLRAERDVVSLRNFWRYPFLRESAFLERADTADVLLFRGQDFPARLQRGATGALYDHVGLLLRTGCGEILLLEAMGRTGVSVCPWERFKRRGWHLVYDWMAYRKVYFDRSPTQLDALQAFIDAVRGQPYGLTVDKLLNRTLSAAFDEEGRKQQATGDGKDEEELASRTFFCSELVAACLKRCGVLAGAAASARYWPGSFSQRCEDSLPLQPHAHFGCEEVLVFDV